MATSYHFDRFCFPTLSSDVKKRAILAGFSVGRSLPSTLFDLAHLNRLLQIDWKLKREDITILVESQSDLEYFEKINGFESKGEADQHIMVMKDKGQFLAFLTKYINDLQNCLGSNSGIRVSQTGIPIPDEMEPRRTMYTYDIFFALSSHGFDSGQDDYIMLNGQAVYGMDIHRAIIQPLTSESIRLLALSDLCHSEKMLDLPVSTTDFITIKHNGVSLERKEQKSLIACISACAESQLSSDDISKMGFGGGLISAFIDNWKPNQSIKQLYVLIQQRLRQFAQEPVLSSDHSDFFFT